jgi:hypothetical protein
MNRPELKSSDTRRILICEAKKFGFADCTNVIGIVDLPKDSEDHKVESALAGYLCEKCGDTLLAQKAKLTIEEAVTLQRILAKLLAGEKLTPGEQKKAVEVAMGGQP